MPRDTTSDGVTKALMQGYVNVLSGLAGWGVTNNPSGVAVYPRLDLPFPQEPFPACYVFLGGVSHDYGQGTGLRRDTATVIARIIGGPLTPGYQFNPEDEVYTMLTGVVNELMWRRFLEDPTNGNAPFTYNGQQFVDPAGKVTVLPQGRITPFSYGEQGLFAGIDVPSTVLLAINIGRLS